jgi:ferritin-like metal-binding protein YciE
VRYTSTRARSPCGRGDPNHGLFAALLSRSGRRRRNICQPLQKATITMKTLNDLFIHFLQDVYYAERQLLKALPKMAKNAQDASLKEAFTTHREETVHQIERLEQVFEQLGRRARGVPCEAIKGLIEECEELLEDSDPGAVRDAGLVACGQAIEHYEMARYGALIAWAKAGSHKEIVGLLQETLDEEKKADKLLNDLANRQINKDASAFTKAA